MLSGNQTLLREEFRTKSSNSRQAWRLPDAAKALVGLWFRCLLA